MKVLIRIAKDKLDKAMEALEALGFIPNQRYGVNDDPSKPGYVLTAGELPDGEFDSANLIDGVDVHRDPLSP